MSELAQKQVTPDTSKDMQKIFIFCFKYFMILNEKIYILFKFCQRKVRISLSQ